MGSTVWTEVLKRKMKELKKLEGNANICHLERVAAPRSEDRMPVGRPLALKNLRQSGTCCLKPPCPDAFRYHDLPPLCDPYLAWQVFEDNRNVYLVYEKAGGGEFASFFFRRISD